MSMMQEKMYMNVEVGCYVLFVSKFIYNFFLEEKNQRIEGKRIYCSSWKNLYEIPGRKDLWHESRGLVMGVYKEGKTGKYRSITKTGRETEKENRKEGFRTKGEAKEWEKDFLQQQSQGVDIEFGNFLEIYYKDMDVYNPFQSRK